MAVGMIGGPRLCEPLLATGKLASDNFASAFYILHAVLKTRLFSHGTDVRFKIAINVRPLEGNR